MNIFRNAIRRAGAVFPLLLLSLAAFTPTTALSDELSVGYVAWDETDPGVAGEFDVVDQTGPNSSGDATWPVTTTLAFQSLALAVHFTDGTTSNFGASYFTQNADGLSFDGGAIAIGAGKPKPIDATLTGVFNHTALTLFDGSRVDVASGFAALIPFRAGGLSDGDLQIITATSTTATVPEPATWPLLAAALAALLASGRRKARGPRAVWRAVALLLLSGTACASVKLNLWSMPDHGIAGTTFVNLTGSGFPTANGAISAGSVHVSLASTCNGAGATATVSSVTHVIGSSYRIHFELPATLSSGNYFASLSGVTADGTVFASTNCSQVTVAEATDSGALISRSWTIPAGSETYKCRAIQLQSDVYITGFHPLLSPSAYEMVLTYSDTPFAGTGDYNCNAGSGFDGRAFYTAGLGSNDLELPPGVAVHLKAGQFVNLQVHVFNSTVADMTGIGGLAVQTTAATDVTDEAEMIFAGTFNINIPNDGMLHTAGPMGCEVPRDYRIVALAPHMRALGRHIRLQRFSPNTGILETLLDVPYTYQSQLVYPLAPPVQVTHRDADPHSGVHQSDELAVVCTYVNNTDHTVTFGESSTAEECFMGIYRYPLSPAPDAFECVDGGL